MIVQRRACISVMTVLFAILIFSHADTVQARSVSGGIIVPARFFLEMKAPAFEDFAFFQTSGNGEPPLPDGKGKDLVQKDCTTCHAANVWTKQHKNKQEWSEVMDDMVSKGLDASDEEIATMTAYLTANFGPEKKDPPPSTQPNP